VSTLEVLVSQHAVAAASLSSLPAWPQHRRSQPLHLCATRAQACRIGRLRVIGSCHIVACRLSLHIGLHEGHKPSVGVETGCDSNQGGSQAGLMLGQAVSGFKRASSSSPCASTESAFKWRTHGNAQVKLHTESAATDHSCAYPHVAYIACLPPFQAEVQYGRL